MSLSINYYPGPGKFELVGGSFTELKYEGFISGAFQNNYPTGDQGDFYFVNGSGYVGGRSVEPNDILLCVADTPAGGVEVADAWEVISDGLAVLSSSSSSTSKIVSGANYTAGTDSRNELFGGLFILTDASALELPAAEPGMNFLVITEFTGTATITRGGTDQFYIGGVITASANIISPDDAPGYWVRIAYRSPGRWACISNGWAAE